MIETLHVLPLWVAGMVLLIAFLVDAIIGDPRWMPHPVQLIGMLIGSLERLIRDGRESAFALKAKGVVLVVAVTSVVFLVAYLITSSLVNYTDQVTGPFEKVVVLALLVFLTSTTIASRGLIDHCSSVLEAVALGDIVQARQRLSMIVGRDTARLNQDEILKAVIETLSENLSDGVVAPTFYYLIGGLPAAMTYKAVNTLDSMVGYKNERYIHFGWASARLDDLANFIPARLTGLMICLSAMIACRSVTALHSSLRIMLRDGGKHLSPNSGIPEAAMAGALSVRLGGPSYYGGVLVDKPYIGDQNKVDYKNASERAMTIARYTIVQWALCSSTVLCLIGVI